MLRLTVNKQEQWIEEGTTIRQLVEREGFESLQVVVDHNGELLEDAELDRQVSSGDALRILPMVAGG